mmetsp:Transcript_32651/g.97411  ORF Transcript_32651/g.97411 Transcript_32651/m.97411 type:complete len:216 (-) Transcript_32651:601-1248(-)
MQDAQAANLHADSGGAERTPWRAYCTPASFLVAASMSCSCGSASCSRLDAYGIGISAPVTRTTGASSSSNASSMMSDMISLATPDCGQPSSTTIARCVFLTDATIAARSSGLMLLKLSTSQSMPCAASFSATCRLYPTIFPNAIIVRSLPGRMTLALPIGSVKSLSSTAADTGNDVPYSSSFSKNTTGSGSRIAALSSPRASSESYGASTLRPGT